MEKNKEIKILLITNAPFLKAGNQSIQRTIIGLNNKGFKVQVWKIGSIYDDIDGVSIVCFEIPKIFSKIKKVFSFLLLKFRSMNRDKCKNFSFIDPSVSVDLINDYNQWFVHIPVTFYFIIKILVNLLRNKNLKNNIDLIWGYERMGAILGYFVAKILKKPLITSFQGTALTSFIEKYGKTGAFLRLPFDYIATKVKADLIIMTDDGTKGDKALFLLGHSPSKVVFLPNGVDRNVINNIYPINRDELKISKDEILVVVSSRLDIWKRVDRAIYLLSGLYFSGISNVSLLIIGTGEHFGYLKKLAYFLKVDNKVYFLGALPYHESLRYIKAADMVWSFCDHSNLTNTVQDALAMGKFVVTLDDGSLNNYIDVSKYPYVLFIPKSDFLQNGIELVKSILKSEEFNFRNAKNLSYIFFTWDERIDFISNKIQEMFQKFFR